jgi:hypothetical protein
MAGRQRRDEAAPRALDSAEQAKLRTLLEQ